jgi:Polyketide cyclase / dehydrase and lipid transport
VKTRVIQDDPEPEEIGIDQAAPVLAARETEIAATSEVVWDVLAGIVEWPSWNPEVRSVSMDDGLAEGSEFRWKAGPGTITSRLQHVERPRRIAWSGATFGIDAMHVYALEARDGTTLVRTEESYDGLVARLFRRRLQKTLDGALESGLRHLKAEAERRVATHLAAERRS